MATIEIGLKRYLKFVYYIVILSILVFPIFMTSGDASDWFSRESILRAVIKDLLFIVLMFLEYFLCKMLDCPVQIIIDDNHLDIQCKLFFLKNRRYSWSKGDVSISYKKVFGLPFDNHLRRDYRKMNKHQVVVFLQFILKKELMSQILDELIKHGYNLNESWGLDK